MTLKLHRFTGIEGVLTIFGPAGLSTRAESRKPRAFGPERGARDSAMASCDHTAMSTGFINRTHTSGEIAIVSSPK
jgi:hypothetical protein